MTTHYVSDAVSLIEELGGSVVTETKPGSGFIFKNVVWVVHVFDATHQFDREYEMAQWVVNTIAPRVLAEDGAPDAG
jgi:hypothetical protein